LMTNDVDETQRAVDWVLPAEPRCRNPIAEAWLLTNLMSVTRVYDRVLAARLQRIAERNPSPSLQAITDFMLHAVYRMNPEWGGGFDSLENLERAIACSRSAGNIFVEGVCMLELVTPLIGRVDLADAGVLRATLQRIHAVRFDFGLHL